LLMDVKIECLLYVSQEFYVLKKILIAQLGLICE